MCGIFGGIGKVNPGVIRALALANRERGIDSLGFFNSGGKILKRAGDPLDVLTDRDFQRYIDKARGFWFIAGHTRMATCGRVCTRNAHPFRYGKIIGAHNGIVDAPLSYRVDSEYLIDLLSKGPDYHTALDEVRGYWGLSWYDGTHLYLQAHGAEIAIGQDKRGAWYYSSAWEHLEACANPRETQLLHSGMTVRFSPGGVCEVCKPFIGGREWAIGKYSRGRTLRTSTGRAGEDFRYLAELESADPFDVWKGAEFEGREWERASEWEDLCNDYGH
jgi:hypothetical protein